MSPAPGKARTAVVVLADGFEEIEAVTPVDILRRAGIQVTVAGVGKTEVTGSNGLRILADTRVEQVQELPDVLVLPGGAQGAANLRDSAEVSGLIHRMAEARKLIAAICAAPAVVLAKTGVLDGRKATCYPGYEKTLPGKIYFSDHRVVSDDGVITSRGPGTALEFSLQIVRELVGKEVADVILQKTLARA